jgi:two-component system, sensor histidine kinase and response regulator
MGLNNSNQSSRSNVSPLKILVVDDDDLNRRMMQVLLRREGHQVELAANGMEAVEAVKNNEFDIVFMDLQMPTIDGIETSRRIRNWEEDKKHTFIVALTASYLPEQGQELFEAGIDNYISKPFEVEHIERMLGYSSKAIQTKKVVAADANPIFDAQKGIQRVGGDLDTYKELLSDFVQELPGKTQAMQSCFDSGDWDGLARASHNLKGVSANLGAVEVSEAAQKLEKQCIEGYTEQNSGLVEDVKRAIARFQEIATEFLAQKTVQTG